MPAVQASAWRWVRLAAITLTLFLGYQLLLVLRSWWQMLFTVAMYIVFGAVLSLVLNPLARRLESIPGIGRTAASLGSVAILVWTLGGLAFLAAGPLTIEAQGMAAQAPIWLRQLQGVVDGVNRQLYSTGLPVDGVDLSAISHDVAGHLPGILLTGVAGVATLVVDTVMVLVVCFWLLRDGQTMRTTIVTWTPATIRSEVVFALDAVQVVVGGYVRAQLLMATLVGILAGAGCYILGVPFPLLIGITVGLFELVPIIGTFTGGAIALALALTQSPQLAAYTLVLFLAIHVLEGYILAPRIQARFVRIHPMFALLALFAGTEAGGLMGVVMAVPAVSLGAVFIRAAMGDWRAHRPDLFEMARTRPAAEQRRRHLLREFRLRRRPRPEVG